MSQHLSARLHFADREPGHSFEVVVVQHVFNGDVQVIVPAAGETTAETVAHLILQGVPPSRIWPSRIVVGQIVGMSATVAIP